MAVDGDGGLSVKSVWQVIGMVNTPGAAGHFFCRDFVRDLCFPCAGPHTFKGGIIEVPSLCCVFRCP